MNDEQAAKIFNFIVTGWPDKKLPDATIELWIDMIDDIDYEDAQQAAREIVKNDHWFPSVARFRQACMVHASRRSHRESAERGLPQGGFAGPPQALLAATREMIAERKRLGPHNHHGPDPCPVCGGLPHPPWETAS